MDNPTSFRFSPRPNHAHEILWRPWSADAFAEAERQQKPVLLAISAVWCHWCHVMDETTYSDPAVIATINAHFIPIRVDNDQRPDINLRYNMGGWPSTAFLTPLGETLTGGTYIPPDQMQALLAQVREYWDANRHQLGAAAPVEKLEPDTLPKPPPPEGVEEVLGAIRTQFDRAYGGLGQAPKFPHPDVWELCLARFVLAGEGWGAGMAVRTLDAMAGGSMYDGLAGGFFRYSTTREWTVPHFEKMLDDNARLALLYLHAYQVMGDEAYRDVASQVLTWMSQSLLQPTGLFGGSQDADEEYYRLPPEERANHPSPYVDPTAYAGWNALAVQSFLLASALIDENWRAVGLTCLEVLFMQLWDPERGLTHDTREGRVVNWLPDLTAMGLACLDAYDLTGDSEHLTRAQAVLGMMQRDLTDGLPGFLDHPQAEQDVGRLLVTQKPLAENAEALRFVHRLGRVTRTPDLVVQAEGWLGAFAPLAQRFGVFGASWALTATVISAPPLDATLVTNRAEHSSLGIWRAALLALYDLNRAVTEIDVNDPERETQGYSDHLVPALYLCRDTICANPVTDPGQIPDQYRSLIVQPD